MQIRAQARRFGPWAGPVPRIKIVAADVIGEKTRWETPKISRFANGLSRMSTENSLNRLAAFLGKRRSKRRNQITRDWVEAVRTDPKIQSSDRLGHEQLVDHVPDIFGDLAATLRGIAGAREQSKEVGHVPTC